MTRYGWAISLPTWNILNFYSWCNNQIKVSDFKKMHLQSVQRVLCLTAQSEVKSEFLFLPANSCGGVWRTAVSWCSLFTSFQTPAELFARPVIKGRSLASLGSFRGLGNYLVFTGWTLSIHNYSSCFRAELAAFVIDNKQWELSH